MKYTFICIENTNKLKFLDNNEIRGKYISISYISISYSFFINILIYNYLCMCKSNIKMLFNWQITLDINIL